MSIITDDIASTRQFDIKWCHGVTKQCSGPLRCIYNIITLERVRRISDASRCEVTAVSDLDLQLRQLANEMLVI